MNAHEASDSTPMIDITGTPANRHLTGEPSNTSFSR